MTNKMRKRLECVNTLLGLSIEWREQYNGLDQEAYTDEATKRALTKLLGKPVKTKEDDQEFWTYKPSRKLQALGVTELYIERYKKSSTFLCVIFSH